MAGEEKTLLKEILGKRPDLKEEQVRALIAEKIKVGKGLLSFEGAARLVAEDLKIKTPGVTLGRPQIKGLVAGLNDISLSGRVLVVGTPQTFAKKDGTPGRVVRILVADRSGRVTCVLWDTNVDRIEKLEQVVGRIMRVGHGYTRHGLGSRLEVHVGGRGSIEFDPQDVPVSDFPSFEELFTRIGDIRADMEEVNVVGVVQSEPRTSTFTREGSEGIVLRTLIADESGMITVVAWNERGRELQTIAIGSILQIMNAKVKLGLSKRRELHVDSKSHPMILPESPAYLQMPVRKTHRIGDLIPQVSQADMVVGVVVVGSVRDIKRSSGEKGKVADMIVGDETGLIALSLWDDKAELVHQNKAGDTIELLAVGVSERLGDISLSLGKYGELKKAEPKKFEHPTTKLNALETSKGLLIVEGTVDDAPVVRQVTTAKGEVVDLASFTLKDDTGSAKITVWRNLAAEASKLQVSMKVKIVGLRVQIGLNRQLELASSPLTVLESQDQTLGQEQEPEPEPATEPDEDKDQVAEDIQAS